MGCRNHSDVQLLSHTSQSKTGLEITCLLELELRQWEVQGGLAPAGDGTGAAPWQDNAAKSNAYRNALVVVWQYAITISCVLIL